MDSQYRLWLDKKNVYLAKRNVNIYENMHFVLFEAQKHFKAERAIWALSQFSYTSVFLHLPLILLHTKHYQFPLGDYKITMPAVFLK